jgi:fumarate reductase subunit C
MVRLDPDAGAKAMSRRPYVRKLSKLWWLGRSRYTAYMIRELTCLLIGAYAGLVVVGLLRLSQGRAAYEAFLEALASPLGIAFHVLALLFTLFHMVTWFGLAPKAMALRIGGRKLPDAGIVMAHYAAWIGVSAGIMILAGS